MKFFISYSHDDSKWVYHFRGKLREHDSHDIWIDKNIPLGADWWNEILNEIEKCECLIYILTPNSVTSKYCRAEVNYALALNKPILPIMLEKCRYPRNLKRVEYKSMVDYGTLEDLLNDVEQGLQYFVKNSDKYQPKTTPRPAYPEELSWRGLPITNFSVPTENLKCITRDKTVAEAHNILLGVNFRYRHLLITETGETDSELLGMISLRQMIKLRQKGVINLPNQLVSDAMDVYNPPINSTNPSFVCIYQDDTLEEALKKAFLRRLAKAPGAGHYFYFSAIPIIDDDHKPIGIISFKDILREMDQGILPIPDVTVGKCMRLRQEIYASTESMNPNDIRPDIGATGQRDVPVVDTNKPNRLLGYVPDHRLLDNLNGKKTMGDIMVPPNHLKCQKESTSLARMLKDYLPGEVATLYYSLPVVEEHPKFYKLLGLIGYRDIFQALLDS